MERIFGVGSADSGSDVEVVLCSLAFLNDRMPGSYGAPITDTLSSTSGFDRLFVVADFNFKQKPSGFFKWILHAPTWIYRAHAGFIMGNRFLMIEHRGRKSGNLYRTVLEVAGRYSDRNEWIVTSGTGPNADWYRNLRAGKFEAVWVGSKRRSATVRFLESEEAGAVFHGYETSHPKAATKLMESMGVSYDGTDEDRIEMLRKIPMVSFALA